MRVFRAEPAVQPPQGRSGRFRTRFSPVMAEHPLAIRNGCSTRTLAFSALAAALPSASVRRLPGFMAICHDTSRCARSGRFLIPRYPASVQACFSSPCRSRSEGAGHDVDGCSLRLARQPVDLQLAEDVGVVVSSGTFSSITPAKHRTLSAAQSKSSIAGSPAA